MHRRYASQTLQNNFKLMFSKGKDVLYCYIVYSLKSDYLFHLL